MLDGVEPLAGLLHVAQAELFGFPLFAEAGQLLAEFLDFLLNLFAAIEGVLFGFFGELAIGEFELRDAALDLIDFARDAFEFHGQAAGGFVDQVDGFVGQEAVGDVALRELGRGDEGGIFDFYIVMRFVAGLETAEDGDGVVDGWARRRRPAGNGVPGRHLFRCACDIRPAWLRRCSGVRRGRAPA